jgi:signal transduction histidine kinase
MSNEGDDRRGEDDVNHIMGIAAHELKNALGPLAMTLQICERRAAAGEPVAREDLAFARAAVHKVSQLVNDLLDTARIESGQFPLRMAPLDLCALVQGTVDTFRRANPRRIVCDVPPEPLMHTGDGARLAALLTNFLDNAAKYAAEPSPIEVRMSQAGERIRIAVTDHGPGIKPDDQKRLFQRYFRASDTAGVTHGLGLGLYLCRAIADRHGGTLGVDSVPGRGSTFWLDLSLGQT